MPLKRAQLRLPDLPIDASFSGRRDPPLALPAEHDGGDEVRGRSSELSHVFRGESQAQPLVDLIPRDSSSALRRLVVTQEAQLALQGLDELAGLRELDTK